MKNELPQFVLSAQIGAVHHFGGLKVSFLKKIKKVKNYIEM